ncbi:response regulator [Desulfitobacterium sp.]|uniref:response regulator n=1 Tax=Desulfitobacterium sp. TaxID=49981 RepID=UPI002B1FFA3D|nr:response regulator [Desulfitobacterium sp.]MEA4902147.1 response regulator [Desulfitobacterium sp.]
MGQTGKKILIIDDESPIQRLLKVTLTAHDYEIHLASDAKDGLDSILAFKPDLIILDLGLPDLDGLEVIKIVRDWSKTPILILSAREDEGEKIQALDLGADDYITKPFGMGELLARVRAALRHAGDSADQPVMTFDNLVVDRVKRMVFVDGKEVKLTPTEYELLKTLATNAGRVLTHRFLLDTVWGPHYEKEGHYLRIYIGQLRKKCEANPSKPQHILTEPGVGYRLV